MSKFPSAFFAESFLNTYVLSSNPRVHELSPSKTGAIYLRSVVAEKEFLSEAYGKSKEINITGSLNCICCGPTQSPIYLTAINSHPHINDQPENRS